MKKRILAMLLSASLALSALPAGIYAADGEATAPTADPLANAEWTGAAAMSDSLGADVSDEYVHLYGQADYDEYFYYSDPSVTLKSGVKYRLSFYIRTIPSIGFTEQSQALFYNSKDILAAPGAITVDANVVSTTRSNRMVLSTEWCKVSTIFEGDGKALVLYIKSGDPDGTPNCLLPMDIRDMKLYEIDSVYCDVGSNLASNDASKWHYVGRFQDPNNGGADKYIMSDFVSMDSDNPTAKLSGIVLEPGKYELSADFRLNTYDFSKATNLSTNWRTKLDHSKYTAPLTVTGSNGISLTADALDISTEWKNGKFAIEVPAAVNAGELTFTLGDSIGFDIANVAIKKLASYTDEYVTAPDNTVETVESDRKYIQVSGITYCDNGAVYYTDTAKTFESGKTYTITFDARTVSAKNFPNGNRMIRLHCNGEYSGLAGFVYVNDSWKTYTLTYHATANSSFKIKFCGSTLYWDVLPVEIDNLSVVESSSGSEMVEYDDIISSTVGWSGSAGAKVTMIDGNDYYSADASTTVKPASDDIIPAGVYKLTANFRLKTVDYNKLTFNSSYYVTADANKTTVTAYNGSTALKTLDGETDVTVNAVWTAAQFLLTVPAGTTVRKSDISFKFAEAVSFDFTDITLSDMSDVYSDEYITDSEFPAARMDDPAPAAGIDEYVRISNIRANGDRLVYNDPSVSLSTENTYDVSFYIRAAHSSEWLLPDYGFNTGILADTPKNMMMNGVGYTNVRISLNENTFTSKKITDEWIHISQTVTPGRDGQLELLIFDYATHDLLPYEVAGLSVKESGTGKELISNSAALKSTDGYGWYPFEYGRGTASVPHDLSVSVHEFGSYFSVQAGKMVKPSDDAVLESGVWEISTELRLPDLKSSNIVMKGGTEEGALYYLGWISEDNNKAELTAYSGTDSINTADGEETVTVDTTWTKVSFLIVVPEGTTVKKSDIALKFDEAINFDFKDITFTDASALYLDSFISGNGLPIEIVKDEFSNYLRAYGITYVDNGAFYYTDSAASFEEGKTYTISFDARTMESIDYPNNGKRVVRIFCQGDYAGYAGAVYLSSGWTHYTLTYTPEAASRLRIKFIGSGIYDVLPVDIANLSVVENESGTEMVRYAKKLSTTGGWSGSSGSSVALSENNEFYRVYAPTEPNAATSFSAASSEELIPGVYSIKGKFRLAEAVDYNKMSFEASRYQFPEIVSDNNMAKLTVAAANGINLKTGAGADAIIVNPYWWSSAEFILDTAVPVNMDTIEFMLDSAYGLDFCDVSIELIERKATLSEVSPGIIMTLLMLKKNLPVTELKFKSNSADDVITVKETIADGNADYYIHVSNLRVSGDGVKYIDPDVILTAGKSYKFKMSIRSAYTSDWFDGASYTDGTGYTNVRAKLGGRSVSISKLSANWQNVSATIIPTSTAPLSIVFDELLLFDILPYDIANMSLVEVGTDIELIKYANQISVSSSAAGWAASRSPYRKIDLPFDVALDIREGGTYYRIGTPTSGTTQFSVRTSNTLSAGTHYISADFRLTELKLSKMTTTNFDTGSGFSLDAIVTNDNKTTVSAYYKDQALKVYGKDQPNAEITTDWTNAVFEIVVPEGTSVNMSDIVFKLGTGEAVEFANLEYLTESDMSDNILDRAISEKALANWSFGDQTLEYKVDADGTKYLAASNITNNRLGFIYNADTVLTPGTYILTGDFRTSVEGETGNARVIFNGLSKTIKINNEWSHLEMIITLDQSKNLEFKICGPANSLGIQNYDIANLSILDMADTIPIGVNFYEEGHFDNADTALNGWTMYYHTPGTLLTNEFEGDNGFLRMSNRPYEYSGITLTSDFLVVSGVKYKVTYRIRCSVEGESMVVRNYISDKYTPLIVVGETYNNSGYLYHITDEWKDVEAYFTADNTENFIFKVAGGMAVTDINSFDIDNLTIEKVAE